MVGGPDFAKQLLVVRIMSVDLVKFGPYAILAHMDDDWYERVAPPDRGLSIYDLAIRQPVNIAEPKLAFTALDPLTQSFELLIAYYCQRFPRFALCDVGAHYGIVMMDFARVIRSNNGSADLYAFDAGRASELTWRNFENNGFDVRFEQAAVGPFDGHAPMYVGGLGGSENNRLVNGRGGESIAMRCVQLDTFLRQESAMRPACVKIDVQGAEPGVLMGMAKLMAAHPTTIQIECTPWAMHESGVNPVEFIEGLLQSHYLFDIGASRERMLRISDATAAITQINACDPYWTDCLIVPHGLPGVADILARFPGAA